MIKLATIARPAGPSWHLLVAPRPGDWFFGERQWPEVARPVLLMKGFGPLQLRRYLTTDEIDARCDRRTHAPGTA